MSDWKEYKLGELATFYNGRAYKNGEFKTSGTPIVRIQNLTGEGKTVYSDLQLDENKYIENGDLIYAWSATFGPYIWRGEKSIYHYHIWKIVCNEKIIDKFYFYYKLKLISDSLKDNGNGSIFVHITKSFMENFKIKIPSLEKQKYISNILSNLDKKIRFNTQINQTLEQIAQALFKSWFVDFDPVRAKVQALSDGLSLEQAELAAMQTISGKTPEELTALLQTQPERYAELAETAKAFPYEIVEVDGVEVPKGWEVTPLSGLFALISGTQIPKEEHIYEAKEGYERFIQNRDYSSNNHITYVEISKKNKRCTEKDILIDRYGDAGKIRFGISGVYNIALAKIVLNDNNLTEYLRWFLMQPKQKAYFEQASGASTRASLNTSTFKGINVVIPSNFILNIFSKISNTYLDSLRNLKEENNTLMKTRDSLLPKLLKQDV